MKNTSNISQTNLPKEPFWDSDLIEYDLLDSTESEYKELISKGVRINVDIHCLYIEVLEVQSLQKSPSLTILKIVI